jgi:nickel/cobalt exporter
VALGALHALEPGHAKSLMAAFVITIRGTPAQAALLGLSAAIGHTIVVWALVLLGLSIGSDLIEQQAYPWLVLASGIMVMAIAARLIWTLRPLARFSLATAFGGHHAHQDIHGHRHGHDHGHANDATLVERFGDRPIRAWEIAWFGYTGGLLPCPSAIAVLLVAIKLRAIALGAVMVGAFSLGLAVTLVAVGVAAAWGTRQAASWSGFDRWAKVLPVVSLTIVLLLGIGITLHGLALVGAFA